MADENRNDLVLSPNEYAYVLDTTKGQVSVYVGPNKTSLSNSDRLVQYNHNTNRIAYFVWAIWYSIAIAHDICRE